MRLLPLVLLAFAASVSVGPAQQTSSHPRLEFTKWSGTLNVPDPVAITLDNQGRAFVTQTQRRKSQDLDIRQHRNWVPNDVGFQSVEAKRDFYHTTLAIGNDEANAAHVDDHNQDGHHDYRDLMVLSEKIHMLQDTDADGTADSISLFAEDFRTEVTGIAAGVLHYQDHIFATIAPDVWKLSDTTSGASPTREVIATGFGLHIAYAGHDMHGLTVGPDGKIYWSIGDKGISVTTPDGQRHHYPNQGGVLRANPDGSNFEVFAHGLRNVQELAFDAYGNLFGVDNDADKQGERERFVYIVKGMDAGWRCNYQYRSGDYDPWMAERLWQPWHEGQPAYILPPISHSIDGPAGFAFNPGTALATHYRDYFFLTGAPNGNQIAFQVERDGASFRMQNEHTIGSGLPLVGINFGPDGGLYAVDWGGGYPLNQTGAVWKIDAPASTWSPHRDEVQRLLSAGFSNRNQTELLALLAHADQRVRLGAQFELVDRKDAASLASTAHNTTNLLARIHAVWGLGQLASASDALAQQQLATLLQDTVPEFVAATLRVIGDLPTFDSPSTIVRLLASPHPMVTFAAASAIADHPVPAAVPTLIRQLETCDGSDTYLRFALTRALARCAGVQELAALNSHANKLVRLAAVVALRNQANSAVRAFLDDSSVHVAAEAAIAIHDDFSILDALPALAERLPHLSHDNESMTRRAINANFRLGGQQQAERILAFALDTNRPKQHRLTALNALRLWQQPPRLDLVTGRARDLSQTSRSLDADPMRSDVSALIANGSPDIQAAVLAVANAWSMPVGEEPLLAAVRNGTGDVGIVAIDLLANQGYPRLNDLLTELVDADQASVHAQLRTHALQLLAERAPQIATPRLVRLLRQSQETAQRQLAANLLGGAEDSAADAALLGLLDQVSNGKHPELRLELIEAARRRADANASVRIKLQDIETQRSQAALSDPTALFDDCLAGGNPQRGARLFSTHLGAQCIRCHRVGRRGSNVGPRLDAIGSRRDARHLLRAMVAPSADIEKEYRTQLVVLASGETLQGFVLEQDERSMTLVDAQGKEVQVELDEVEESIDNELSLMPEMTKALSRRELRDLVAYLQTLKQTD